MRRPVGILVVCSGTLLAASCFDWDQYEHGTTGPRPVASYSVTHGAGGDDWIDACEQASHWSAPWAGASENGLQDDGAWWVPTPALPADFAFAYYDQAPIHGVLANVNGALAFSGTLSGYPAAVTCPLGANPDARPYRAFPFWDDLQGFPSGPMNASQICAATLGVAPARRFVVTWHDLGVFNEPNGNNHLTFSVLLEEGSNVVEFVYHTLVLNSPGRAGGARAAVGLVGADATQASEFACNQRALAADMWVKFTPEN